MPISSSGTICVELIAALRSFKEAMGQAYAVLLRLKLNLIRHCYICSLGKNDIGQRSMIFKLRDDFQVNPFFLSHDR